MEKYCRYIVLIFFLLPPSLPPTTQTCTCEDTNPADALVPVSLWPLQEQAHILTPPWEVPT